MTGVTEATVISAAATAGSGALFIATADPVVARVAIDWTPILVEITHQAAGILTALGILLTSAIGAFNAWQILKTKQLANDHQQATTASLGVLKTQTDGLTQALVNATGKEEHAKGVVEGEIAATKVEVARAEGLAAVTLAPKP